MIMKKSKVIRIIKHHLDDSYKQNTQINAKDPNILWDKLKARFGHQRKVLFPSLSLMDQ